MFKLETYAKVVDRALIAERNCKHLSKTNDEERKPKSGNFLKGKSSGGSLRNMGYLTQARRLIKLVRDVERIIVGHVTWRLEHALNVTRLDISSRIM